MASKKTPENTNPDEAVRLLASTWRGPRSVCRCTHNGDGSDSEHADIFPLAGMGHGACRVTGCTCAHFSWADWLPIFQAKMDAAGQRTANGGTS